MSKDISQQIIYWYQKNKRDLPWRNTKNPYKIWLSEIILQQTRVVQGMDYYSKFVENYPTVNHLAKAKEIDILNLWQGLGYYSRARNLHFTAKYVHRELKGIFPNNYKELKKLKGIGDYTASAIASFAFDEAVATLDGNVYRVLARYFGIDTPINAPKGNKLFKELAYQILNKEKPYLHNQALMEFGALQCKPQNPDCNTCPLNCSCLALAYGKVKELPVKLKKLKVKDRHLNFFLIIDKKDFIFINERKTEGIWRGLYDFPVLESIVEIEENKTLQNKILKQVEKQTHFTIQKFNATPWLHRLTHLNIYATFWIVRTEKEVELELYKKIGLNDIQDYPLPRLIDNFIREFSGSTKR